MTHSPLLRALVPVGLALAGCAPDRPPLPIPPPPEIPAETEAPRHLLRPVPVPAPLMDARLRGSRSEDGAPGPRYWQQEVSYEIEAELDPAAALIRGHERIGYRNNSPDTLKIIVLHLYQNVFSQGVPRNRPVTLTGGVKLERVTVQGAPLGRLSPQEWRAEPERPGFLVEGTLGRVRLLRPLPPGGSVPLEIDWRSRVPPDGSFRTAWEDALGGRAFQVAQWYPQVATYDDLRGWNDAPYLGDGEFYLEYGDFEVSITVPDGWLVGATGVLQNPEEVLTEEARTRLARAASSDQIVPVVTLADLDADNATLHSPDGALTWRFRARQVRDFAFVTSDRYAWDATRALLADGQGGSRTVAVHALYRPGSPHWGRAARHTRHALTVFSEEMVPYPYPEITTAEGPVFGMEYPMLSFIGRPADELPLYAVISHEVAHQWFPMLAGSNEAAYAWIDEGLASYWDELATAAYFPGFEPFARPLASYLRVAGSEAEVPMMRHTDLVTPYGARGVAAYTKPALMYRALRYLLGERAYLDALATFAREWAFKHPTPYDLFATFERAAGRELDWFFYPWAFETGVIDLAITGATESGDGALWVMVEDLGQLPAPALLVATTSSGAEVRAEIPVERWLEEGRSVSVAVSAGEPIVRLEIDPERIFPDADRSNNVWERD
ncbi:MAG: M1 family metallopeptidase [Longimicrobiaceae bacterium]